MPGWGWGSLDFQGPIPRGVGERGRGEVGPSVDKRWSPRGSGSWPCTGVWLGDLGRAPPPWPGVLRRIKVSSHPGPQALGEHTHGACGARGRRGRRKASSGQEARGYWGAPRGQPPSLPITASLGRGPTPCTLDFAVLSQRAGFSILWPDGGHRGGQIPTVLPAPTACDFPLPEAILNTLRAGLQG